MFKVNHRSTRERFEIDSQLAIKAPERSQRCFTGIYIGNFEHILNIFLVFLSLTLNSQMVAQFSNENLTKLLLALISLMH